MQRVVVIIAVQVMFMCHSIVIGSSSNTFQYPEFLPREPHLTPDDFRNAKYFPKIVINYDIDNIEIQEDIIPDKFRRPHLGSPTQFDEDIDNNLASEMPPTTMETGESVTSLSVSPLPDLVSTNNPLDETTDSTETTEQADADNVYTAETLDIINSSSSTISPEPAVGINWNRKWTGGIIPYVLDNYFDPIERAEIAKAMLTLKSQTCVQFVPRVIQSDYVVFVRNSDATTRVCNSAVGRQGGRQVINLSQRCLQEGHILHEVMHCIGFTHEQSRYDRDKHVTIIVKNIKPNLMSAFEKLNSPKVGNFEGPYDLLSIVHYSKFANAKRAGLITMVANDPTLTDSMGQREGLSEDDRKKVLKYYKCSKLGFSTQLPTTGAGSGNLKCKDGYQNCPSLSRIGYCNKKPWVQRNCMKSCNSCEDSCEDLNPKCIIWAEQGECVYTQDYMAIYCRKTCGFC